VKTHRYELQLEWTGADETGTASYRSYRRDFAVAAPGKPEIAGSSDPAFLGDASRYNPEELLVASLSSCHMLWYLHLCARNGIVVREYTDRARGTMEEERDGSGRFTAVELRPLVTLERGADAARAMALHQDAHRLCFIARSVNFPVSVSAELLERR
jgi:organic hydroperoxide reductase OsmC/OhrA